MQHIVVTCGNDGTVGNDLSFLRFFPLSLHHIHLLSRSWYRRFLTNTSSGMPALSTAPPTILQHRELQSSHLASYPNSEVLSRHADTYETQPPNHINADVRPLALSHQTGLVRTDPGQPRCSPVPFLAIIRDDEQKGDITTISTPRSRSNSLCGQHAAQAIRRRSYSSPTNRATVGHRRPSTGRG